MNELEIFLKLIPLSKTICEAFDYLKKNDNQNCTALLSDVEDGLKTILSKIPLMFNNQNGADFQLQTNNLLKDCYNFKKSKSASSGKRLFQCFENWKNGIVVLYVEAIHCAFDNQANETQAAELMELILEDNLPPQLESVADYTLARIVSRRQPLSSYNLGLKAFELNNRLFQNIVQKENPTYNYIYSKVDEVNFEHCPICNGCGTPYYCAQPVLMNNYDPTFSPMKLWMQCNSCGQLYTYNFPRKMVEPQPESEELGDELYMQPRLSLIAILGDILKKVIPYASGKRLLDVGAGSGELIAAALELECNVEAIEISKRQSQRLASLFNIDIHCMDFLDFHTSNRFNMITMGDVIEHVTSPVAALKKANELLVDDGILWISTPNFESGFSRITKFEDPMWNEPYHISYFCYSGFKKILSDTGFKVLDYSISKRYNGSMEIIAKKIK